MSGRRLLPRFIEVEEASGFLSALARDTGLRAGRFRAADQGSDENTGFQTSGHAGCVSHGRCK